MTARCKYIFLPLMVALSIFCMICFVYATPMQPFLSIDNEPAGYDDEVTDPTGLTYLRTRFYDNTSRFISEDAFVNDTFNRYTPFDADGVNKVDPSGKSAKRTWENIGNRLWHDNWLDGNKGGGWWTVAHAVEGVGAAGAPSLVGIAALRMIVRGSKLGGSLLGVGELLYFGSNIIPSLMQDRWHDGAAQRLENVVNLFPLVNLAYKQNLTAYNGGIAAVTGLDIIAGLGAGGYAYKKYRGEIKPRNELPNAVPEEQNESNESQGDIGALNQELKEKAMKMIQFGKERLYQHLGFVTTYNEDVQAEYHLLVGEGYLHRQLGLLMEKFRLTSERVYVVSPFRKALEGKSIITFSDPDSQEWYQITDYRTYNESADPSWSTDHVL